MPWLNWSLKLHIRLRTISLLISTRNTQVYVQWMPYSFVWLYLIKCVFTCSIFVDSNKKIFLSVLGVFGKYFVFTKELEISKTVLPCFGNSVAGHSSRIPQSRARGSVLAICSRVKGPIARGTRDFVGQLATPSRVRLSKTVFIFFLFFFFQFSSRIFVTLLMMSLVLCSFFPLLYDADCKCLHSRK